MFQEKKIKIKASTTAKMLFMGMFCREKSINQIIEKVHKRKKYRNLFKKKETIPKMHGFRDGIKDINLEELKQINNSFKCKVNNQKYINGKKEVIEEEYHKQINVFARLVGKRPGVILGYEKITCNGNEGKQEYNQM